MVAFHDLSSDKIIPSPHDFTEIKIINDLKTIIVIKILKIIIMAKKLMNCEKYIKKSLIIFTERNTKNFIKVFKEYNFLCNKLYTNINYYSEEKINQ